MSTSVAQILTSVSFEIQIRRNTKNYILATAVAYAMTQRVITSASANSVSEEMVKLTKDVSS